MTKVGPLLFIQQVRNEVSKVTWPSRNETTLTSIIVIIFAIIASLFFFLSDQVMSFFYKADFRLRKLIYDKTLVYYSRILKL